MRFRLLSALIALTGLAAALAAVPASGKTSAEATAKYAVVLAQPPAAGYEGGISGLARTKPQQGKKYDSSTAAARQYGAYLKQTHRQLLDKVGGGNVVYDYTHAVNAFAAELTEAQAAKLEGFDEVLSVEKGALLQVDTSNTPTFLGLTKPKSEGGLWARLGGPGKAGENVIVGIVDGGYWPEHPSFSGADFGKYEDDWHGGCQAGEEFPASTCNNKVIAARWFADGIGPLPEWEYASPRDFGGHGSHTASTAAGNFGVQATGDLAAFGKISGMAPRARLGIYKACYVITLGTGGSCSSLDTAAAIDAAVADGVDVINYSISGTRDNFLDIDEVAFLFAAEAGIYVSASAGNSGPAFDTVAHPSPWITTTGAGTHNRTGVGSVTIDGIVYSGASWSPRAVTGTLVDAELAGVTPAPNTPARQCFSSLDPGGLALAPAAVKDKIVLCDRGGNALVNKGLAVKEAGGIGMVITNVATSPPNTFALIHSVPAVHVLYTAANYAALHSAARAGKTATIAQATPVFNVPAPFIAGFSSRGPIPAGGGDLLKPDIVAPGQDIVAAVAPPGNEGRLFDQYSGTSMSSPHMAGLGALLTQAQEDWSPMAIKSAFMTTSYDLLDSFSGSDTMTAAAQRAFTQGAGHVDPNKAIDPGLVFDSGFEDWLSFLVGQGLIAAPLPALDASDLNLASIAIGDLAGVQTVTRTATAVNDDDGNQDDETYRFSVQGLDGITVTPSAASFRIGVGETKTWSVKFTRTTAPLDVYQGGFITWTGNRGHVVRMPVVIRPVAISAPLEVTGTGGPISYSVTPGFTGTLSFAARGLVPATETSASVAQDPDQTFDPAVATGTYSKTFVVPAGQKLLRVGISEDAIVPTGTDLDVYLFLNGELVDQAADGDSNEMVTVPEPDAGTYTVYVHGWNTNSGPTGSASFTLFEWQVGSTSAGNMTVPGPMPVVLGQPVTVTLTFSGLAADTRYLGQVVYLNPAEIGTTIVSVNT